MWKGVICVFLHGQHWWLCCHPRPGCSHQTQSPPRELLFLWVPVDNAQLPSFFPSSASLSVSLFVTRVTDFVLSCVSLLSRLWEPGEEPVGMRSIPHVTFVLIRRMKNYLLAWLHVKQSHSPSAVCWFSSSVSVLKCRTADQPMRPYLKENLPKRMHFANNKRIERGHLYMKRGWQAAL